MPLTHHLKPEKHETSDFLMIVSTLAFLFSMSFNRFSSSSEPFISTFIQFFLFIGFLLAGRMFVMKCFAYRSAFEIEMKQTYFNKFWFRKFDKVSSYVKGSFKGIPVTLLSLFIYFITLGYFIFPGLWRYKIKKIPYKFLGSRQKFEYEQGHMYNLDISEYRQVKVIFLGYIYYLFFAFLMKLILPNDVFFSWLLYALFWIAFVSLVPILGTEGFELWLRSKFAWISAFVILFLGMGSMVIFDSLGEVLISAIFSIIIFMAVIFYKEAMK